MSSPGQTQAESLYPRGPAKVPENLTALPPGYVRQAILVLACLYLFLVVYVALLVGSGWLVYWAIWKLPWDIGARGRAAAFYLIGLKLPSIFGSVMLCLFLIKGIFKRPHVSKDTRVLLKPAEHPRLFDFIQKLCYEVQAPLPKKVYVNHEVNAAVFYDASVLGLFWPVRKNLLIGLGLVNMLNLSEFKAALAHEFGHFAQSAMKLGSYVYTANRLILAMVYERDWWDDWLEKWKGLDLRISWLAYALAAVTWTLRKLLIGIFVLVTLVERGLSRAMEYHADKVAVSVAGSEALARCLYKLEPGSEALGRALADLYWASERQWYSRDLFYHQTQALLALRREKNDPNYGVPPPVPRDPQQRIALFAGPTEKSADAWDTHPPEYLRERNACNPYVVAEQDERSPWLLFGCSDADVQRLREGVTRRVYRYVLDKRLNQITLRAPEEVQRHIDVDHAALTLEPKYQALYEGRYLFAEQLDDWIHEAEAQPPPPEASLQKVREIYQRDWQAVKETRQRLLQDLQTVQPIAEGKVKPDENTFTALGRSWPIARAKEVQRKIEAELRQITEQYKAADKAVFIAYYTLARQLSQQASQALVNYYRWACRLEGWSRQLERWANVIEMVEYLLTTDANFGREQGANIVETFMEIRRELETVRQEMWHTPVPKLVGLTDEPPTFRELFPGGLVPLQPDEEQGLSVGEWLTDLSQQVCGARTRALRLYLRTLKTILAVHEEIERRWHNQQRSKGASAS